jgi:hypothetical protein
MAGAKTAQPYGASSKFRRVPEASHQAIPLKFVPSTRPQECLRRGHRH